MYESNLNSNVQFVLHSGTHSNCDSLGSNFVQKKSDYIKVN